MTSTTKDHAEPNYWMVWLALAVLTVVELLVAKVSGGPGTRYFVIFSLCALALAKAALVAAYFMHLKFEKGALILIVVSPLLLSAILYVGLVPDAVTHIHWLAR